MMLSFVCMRKLEGSHGIYFVIRLPERWQLVAFPFDAHADGGHPEYWEAFVTKMLVEAWSPKLFKGKDSAQRQRAELRLKAELDLHYDGFPRGRVTWIEHDERFAIYHGDNLKPTMKVTRKAVEKAFGLTRANWEFDDHEQCTSFSAEGLRTTLGIREEWKTTESDFS